MLPGWALLLVSVGYAALLFGVAWLGDRFPLHTRSNWLRAASTSMTTSAMATTVTPKRTNGSRVWAFPMTSMPTSAT